MKRNIYLLEEITHLKNQLSSKDQIIKSMEISILELKSQMSVDKAMNSGRSD